MKVTTSIKTFERQTLHYRTGCRGLKFLSNMLLNSACEDNLEGQLAVCFEWPNDYCNKFRHQIPVVTLVESIYNDDCGLRPRQTGKNRVSHRHDRLNNQSFELVCMRLTENRRIVLDDISNQRFGGRRRNGQLISQCRDKASNDASVPCPSKKEETHKKPAFIAVVLSDGLWCCWLSRPSQTTEPTDGPSTHPTIFPMTSLQVPSRHPDTGALLVYAALLTRSSNWWRSEIAADWASLSIRIQTSTLELLQLPSWSTGQIFPFLSMVHFCLWCLPGLMYIGQGPTMICLDSSVVITIFYLFVGIKGSRFKSTQDHLLFPPFKSSGSLSLIYFSV